jgi:hypothetical protein
MKRTELLALALLGSAGLCPASATELTPSLNALRLETAETAESTEAAVAHPNTPQCAAFYADRPGFKLDATRAVDAIAPKAQPAKGVARAEPAYKTCRTRVTDHQADGVAGFARNDYSRRQAFNANHTRRLVVAHDGAWHLYDADTQARIRRLPFLAGDAEPQWHPTDPKILYYLPTNGVGMTLHQLDVTTGQTRRVADFTQRLKALWPDANAAWTRSEGSPSADGRYWCLMVDNADWQSRGVFVWDQSIDKIVGHMDTNGERPDHVSMSPSGAYCVVSGDGARGTTAYSRSFSSSRQVHHKSEHSDLALNAEGDDVYVSIDYQSNAGDVFMTRLKDGKRTVLFPTYIDGTATALHVSGKAFDKPGWVLISTYGNHGLQNRQWLHQKLMAVQLKPDPVVYNLAFHRVRDAGYWTEPVASVNRAFTRVVYNSNWGVDSETDVDSYEIDLPQGALLPKE